MTDTFNVSSYETVTQADLRIKDPVTDAPTAAVFVLAGPEHSLRKRIRWDRERRMRLAIQKTGRMKIDDPEEAEAFSIDEMVSATLGWSGLVLAGAPVAFSPDAARQIYNDSKLAWLRDQVRTGLDERELFIRRSASA